MGETGELYSKMVTNARKDTRLLGYVNYLDWRIKEKRNLIAQHLNDGNKNYASYIEKDMSEMGKLKSEVEQKFVTDKNIASMIAAQSTYRTAGEIINNLVIICFIEY